MFVSHLKIGSHRPGFLNEELNRRIPGEDCSIAGRGAIGRGAIGRGAIGRGAIGRGAIYKPVRPPSIREEAQRGII